MAHFFMVATNENGIISDQFITEDLRVALSEPLGFSDAFIYSHGWWTGPAKAMEGYNHFTIEFARTMMSIAKKVPAGELGELPSGSLGIGIHWPSMLSEDAGSVANLFQAASFYTMEKRADNIGQNAGYLLLRSLFQTDLKPERINLVGHSFGCKVVLSLLEEVIQDKSEVKIPKDIAINVVLLQAACDNNQLEKGDVYGDVASLTKLRMLITTSQEDKALHIAYPMAGKINFFRGTGGRAALGAAGPTDAVVQLFGGKEDLNVGPGFDRAEVVKAAANRLVVADLTALHRAPDNSYKPDVFSGHHSDIFIPEIYELIVGFIFGV
jgi:hypothetical protein